MLHVTNLRLPIDADQTTLYKKLAKHLGVSRYTVYKYLGELSGAQPEEADEEETDSN